MKRRLDISTNYSCDICEFKTKKQSNLLRHLNTDKHIRNERISLDYEENEDCQDLIDHEGEISLCQASEYNVSPRPAPPLSASHEDDGHSDHDDLPVEFACSTYDTDSVYYEETEDAPYNSSTEWFPFPSKLDMLLYILLHSKTHILSDETIRFVWFIMHEVGINMPSITSIKKMSFGNLTAESLLHHSEDQDGTPFWFIKPSSLLKLAISHPETSDKLIRYGRFSSTDTTTHIKEQADGNKWKQEMKGSSAKKAYTIFYAGDFVVNKRTNRIGKIENFLQNNENNNVLAELRLFDRMEYDQNRKNNS